MLDAVTQAQIWRFLRGGDAARGIGLVFVSHSPALTERIATRVVDLAAALASAETLSDPKTCFRIYIRV